LIGTVSKKTLSVSRLLYVVGWLTVFAILVLSVVPADVRPHVMPSKQMEHFTAYLITALILALGQTARLRVMMIALSLMVYSGALGIAKLWCPGRTSSIADFAASSLGVWCGVFLVFLIRHARIWSKQFAF
jgi:VanZ family protein